MHTLAVNEVNTAAVCIACICILRADAARILMIPPQLTSHVLIQESLGEELTRRGHDVSIALGSRYPKPDSILASGMHIVSYRIPQDVPYGVSSDMERQISKSIFNPPGDILAKMYAFSDMLNRDCDLMITDEEFMKRVKQSNFDLVIVETFPTSGCGSILPINLSIPFVILSGALFPWDIGVPALPSIYVVPTSRVASFGFPHVDTP